MKKINKTALFLILTFFTCYSMVGIFYWLGGDLKKTSGVILAVSYMFVPLIFVFVVEKAIYKETGIAKKLKISFKLNKWFLVAWLIMPIIASITMLTSLLFPNVVYTPDMDGMFERFESMLTPEQMQEMQNSMDTLPINPAWIAVAQGMIAGLTVNAIAGFGEELGWRGFLLRQFKHMNFWKASLAIGFIWGLWHAPLILMGYNYPEHPVLGVAMMAGWCILLTPLFNYITLKSKSVIAASIMHGTLNGTVGIAIILVQGGSDLVVGLTGLSGFIVLAIAILGFVVYDKYFSHEKLMKGKIADILG